MVYKKIIKMLSLVYSVATQSIEDLSIFMLKSQTSQYRPICIMSIQLKVKNSKIIAWAANLMNRFLLLK